MSVKKIEQIKNAKWFSVWDIVAFAVIIITAVALILAFTLGKDKSSLGGFYVAYRGDRAFEYSFSDDNPRIFNGDAIAIVVNDGQKLVIRFTAEDGRGFNEITADKKKRTVSVTASNCSSHKDCVYTPELKYNSSTPIICTPHGISVCPLVFEDNGVLQR